NCKNTLTLIFALHPKQPFAEKGKQIRNPKLEAIVSDFDIGDSDLFYDLFSLKNCSSDFAE
ncbi:MAG: hypothetical protein ACE5IW_09755, partial [bacterium]